MTGLEVVYPHAAQAPPPDEVLYANTNWLAATLRRYQDAGIALGGRSYDEGEELLLRGIPLRLRLVIADNAASTNVVADQDRLVLIMPAALPRLDRDSRTGYRNGILPSTRTRLLAVSR